MEFRWCAHITNCRYSKIDDLNLLLQDILITRTFHRFGALIYCRREESERNSAAEEKKKQIARKTVHYGQNVKPSIIRNRRVEWRNAIS